MERDVLEQTREKVIERITSAVKRGTYLDDNAAKGLANEINACIASYMIDYIKAVNLRKYCVEQAAKVDCPDLVEMAKRIEEYIKEERV